jgi:acetyl esterase/lipase
MTIYSWSRLYNIPIANLVDPAAMRPYEAMAHDCIESLAEFSAIEKAEKPLNQVEFLKADPTEIEPWRGIMQKNTPGQAPAGAPVFIAQGTADTTVRPEITKQFAELLCKQGTRVHSILLPGVSHTFAAQKSAGQALAWMSDRFRGAPAPSDCAR